MGRREVILPYNPRAAFMPFHNRTERWSCLVAHRRAGKTVAAINDLIKRAITEGNRSAQYAYIAPFRSQAKRVAWDYLKHYAAPVTKATNESDLMVELLNGAKIMLFGSDNADAMRGMGFNGVYLDEYGDFKPSVWGNVVRPTLSSTMGWAVFGGTPKGKNQFHDIYKVSQVVPDWFLLRLPASVSKLLPDTELQAARSQLSQDQYDQEYECSFDASLLGAYYGQEMRLADAEGRICELPFEPESPVFTAWDLGYRDDTAIWWYQVVRGEIRVMDYYAVSGASIEEIADVVNAKGYRYTRHFLPHDARAKTLASGGKSIVEQLAAHLGGISKLAIVPEIGVQDGIQAVRMILPICYFDSRCDEGLEALRQYQREYDEDKKTFRQTPRHDWCFTGDTNILTRYGIQQIMNLPNTGKVLTSCGWKQYTNPRITRRNAPLVEVQFTNGYLVRCTPEHLFKTENGWKSAESLTKGLQIQSVLTPLLSILMVVYTVYGLVTNTFRGAVKNYIETFGGQRLALFPMVVTSTTKTATKETISSKIWSAYQQKYIYQKHGTKTQNAALLKPLEMGQQPGISLKKADYGINAMLKDSNFGQKIREKKSHVYIATNFLWRWFVSLPPCRNIAQRFAKWLHIALAGLTKPPPLGIESVKKLTQHEDVWCLTVPEAEEFALFNGAIVHNCSHPADAFRMLAVAYRQEAKDQTPPKGKTLQTITLDELWEYEMQHKEERI